MISIDRPQHGGNLIWAATIAGCLPSSIVDFSASINPLGPPRSALTAIQSHLTDLKAYPDPHYTELRLAISQSHPGLDPDWILPGNGSAELLTWAAWDLSQLTETYLFTPAFNDYFRAFKTFNVKVREYPLLLRNQVSQTLVRNQVSLRNLVSQTSQTSQISPNEPKGLLLNNPHNPTGFLFTQAQILPDLEMFDLVVIDEAFMDFLLPTESQSLISLVKDYSNLIILRSLTKFYSLPGLRIGYAIGHPDRLHRWQKLRDPWSVNCLAAAAAICVLQDQEFQKATINWLIPAREKLFNGLSQITGLTPWPSCANFLLVFSQYPVDLLQKMLLEKYQILIRDCQSFPSLGNSYFRIAVRTDAENQLLLNALGEIISSL